MLRVVAMSDLIAVQAEACERLGSQMYARLLSQVADDVRRGGVCAEVLAGHEGDPGPSALALRLMGSVHRLVLEHRADDLATYYPSVGGTFEAPAAWRAFRRVLAEQPDAVRAWLDRPPQTNEVGRSSALYGGLLQLPQALRLPVRLFEIGSSGGLNLLADRFCYRDEHATTYGEPTSPVTLDPAWQARHLDAWPVEIVERNGSDPMPVDVTTAEGRLLLTAYVWPDQQQRLERLRGAFAIAARHPVLVRRASARELVAGIEPQDGGVTVLWHSVMWQYLDRAERADVETMLEELGRRATGQAPFAHLLLEPRRRTPESEHAFLVVLRTWPGGEERVLGTSVGHGVPTTWG